MKSLKGQLLIAAAKLQDANFVRSVVVIVQHGDEGALGLTLNRPLETTVRQVADRLLAAPSAVEGQMHQGGPCGDFLMVLHSEKKLADAEVLPGVYFSEDGDKIKALMRSGAGDGKFFLGCCGWGPGQLEGELQSGSWLTMAADPTQVLLSGDALADQWSRLTEASTGVAVTSRAD